MKFLLKWIVNVIALMVVIHVIAGVSVDNMQTVIIAALLLGLLNVFIKPALVILTLPLSIVTLGLFTLFINGFLFYICAKFISGFTVSGFWSAFWAALLFSIVSSLLNSIFTPVHAFRCGRYRYGGGMEKDIEKDNVIDVEGEEVP